MLSHINHVWSQQPIGSSSYAMATFIRQTAATAWPHAAACVTAADYMCKKMHGVLTLADHCN
jgi:hypothetical protein